MGGPIVGIYIINNNNNKKTRVEEMEATTEMVLNRGNVRCHFNKGGNIDAERNSKKHRCILDQLTKVV
jgi:hypothetical protein